MKIQIIRCSIPGLWYEKLEFPIKMDVIEAVNDKNLGEFFRIRNFDPKDFYYSHLKHVYIAKADCMNDEDYSDEPKQPFCYEFKARPWQPSFKPLDNISKESKENILKAFKNTGSSVIKNETIKHDEGKTCLSDVPQLSLMSVAKVFNYGAKKYSKFNYSSGTSWLRYYDACQRHLNSWIIGEDIDESFCHHIDHAIASLMMLRENIHLNKGEDNRNKIYNK